MLKASMKIDLRNVFSKKLLEESWGKTSIFNIHF